MSLNNLALVDLKVGRPGEAEQLSQRALGLQQRILPPGDADLAQSLNNLAVAYRQLGRAADGEPLLKRAIAIKEQIFGPNHPEVAFHLIPLANAYVNLGRYQEAEPLYLRALDIRLKVFGPDHMDVASVINYLARLQLLMGRTTESIDSSRRAVRLVVNRLNRDAGSRSAPEIASLRDYFDQNIATMQRASEQRILGPEAGSEAFESAQWANQSTAATALAQMAARFGAGNDPLAALVRQQQDAVSELRILDRSLPAEIAKSENQRDPKREETMRRRAAELSAEVERLNKDIAAKFPEYASLVSPKPLAVARVQQLLGRRRGAGVLPLEPGRYPGVRGDPRALRLEDHSDRRRRHGGAGDAAAPGPRRQRPPQVDRCRKAGAVQSRRRLRSLSDAARAGRRRHQGEAPPPGGADGCAHRAAVPCPGDGAAADPGATDRGRRELSQRRLADQTAGGERVALGREPAGAARLRPHQHARRCR